MALDPGCLGFGVVAHVTLPLEGVVTHDTGADVSQVSLLHLLILVRKTVIFTRTLKLELVENSFNKICDFETAFPLCNLSNFLWKK